MPPCWKIKPDPKKIISDPQHLPAAGEATGEIRTDEVAAGHVQDLHLRAGVAESVILHNNGHSELF